MFTFEEKFHAIRRCLMPLSVRHASVTGSRSSSCYRDQRLTEIRGDDEKRLSQLLAADLLKAILEILLDNRDLLDKLCSYKRPEPYSKRND
jgi:hypothetical protein